ncbi:forkhead box protein E1-like [Anneissia japonica]|uniref:forkhead box protein E1-like n=1 Tax=Anneissia japonica TaxID=1529436 RepID=UPI001425963E|nr:forkhead box protein E1-like [Anneissia japonica]
MAEVLYNVNTAASPDTTVQEPVLRLEPQCPDDVSETDVANEIRSDSPAEPQKINKRSRPRPDYMRHVKSPFSYIEMITYVIESNSSTMMTLQDIVRSMTKAFHCFRGGYEGWKNSVRHTLSINDCFKKVLRRPDRPSGKDNFWIMNEDCKHCKLSRMENDWVDIKVRYQQYIKDVGETVDLSVQDEKFTSTPNSRFAERNKQKLRSPTTPADRVYSQVEYRPRYMPMFMPIALPNTMSVMDQHLMDFYGTSQNSLKRPSLDDEPLDLTVKKFKISTSAAVTTQYKQYTFSPIHNHRGSPNGSCSPDFRSSSPPLVHTNSNMRSTRNISPEHCIFRSKVHFPPNADKAGFLSSMAGRMYEYDQDGRLGLVQSIADARRRPIYILSSMPRSIHTATGY